MIQDMKKLKAEKAIALKSEALRLIWLLLIPIGFLLPNIAKHFPSAIEHYYSTALYRIINSVLHTITGIFPFSLSEIVLYSLIIFAIAYIAVWAILLIKNKSVFIKFCHSLVTLLIIFGVTLNAFYLMWGFNYFRPSLQELMQLEVKSRPVSDLEELCNYLATEAKALRGSLYEDANGVFALPDDISGCFERIPACYENIKSYNKIFTHKAAKPKYVLWSRGLSVMGISGIYIPFLAEPNVNVHQDALLIPASAAHECAHGLGIAKENEANFIAYLACVNSDDKYIQYSGYMLALIYSANALYANDEDAYLTLYESYNEGMRNDLRSHNEYWRSFEGPVEETVNKVNDNYLKHNQQESGVKSYGEMVDLLLAWHH